MFNVEGVSDSFHILMRYIMKKVFVYYSLTGNGDKVAKRFENLGYEIVKNKILERCSLLDKELDSIFRMAFRENTMRDDDIACLKSFSQDVEYFHII